MRSLCRRWGRERPVDPSDYPRGPLRELAAARPPAADTPVAALDLIALDLESTGLDPDRDHVVSAGWVPVRHAEVVLREARHVLVRPPTAVGDSATVHGLTDDHVARAPLLADVLPDLLADLRGHVLVAHYAGLEVGFLTRAARELLAGGLPVTYVDTLELERLLTEGEHGIVTPGALRLGACRRRYGLPEYAAHSALTDAIAAAELLLAQAAELSHRSGRAATLADLRPCRRR